MRYRRSAYAGATYFFTVALNRRDQSLLVDHIDLLRQVIRSVKARHDFHIDAIVILPEHLHTVWTLPDGDAAYPRRWSLIKSTFSRQLPADEWRGASRLAKRERGIWQRRYWEHAIRGDVDYARHVDYIHYNPVKHGHVARASDWPYSSIHRLVAAGALTSDWAWDDELQRLTGRRGP